MDAEIQHPPPRPSQKKENCFSSLFHFIHAHMERFPYFCINYKGPHMSCVLRDDVIIVLLCTVILHEFLGMTLALYCYVQ